MKGLAGCPDCCGARRPVFTPYPVREHNVRREYAVEVLNWPEHQGWPAAILEPGWRRSVLLVRPRGSVVIS